MSNSYAKHLYGMLKCPSPHALRLMRGGLSQAELAILLKVAPTTLTDWETGKKHPNMTHLLKMLEHYIGWTKQLELPGLEILAAAAEAERSHRTPPPAPEGE